MYKIRNLKNTYSKTKENYTQEITGFEYFSKHMMKIIEEVEEELKKGEFISFEDWQKEMRLKYNVSF